MDAECSKQSKWVVTKELPILDIVACVLAVVAIITSIVVAVGVHSIHFNWFSFGRTQDHDWTHCCSVV